MSLLPWKNSLNVPVSQGRGRAVPFVSLQDEINRLFEDFFAMGRHWSALPTAFDERSFGAAAPPVDVVEMEKAYKVKAELPGMAAEQLDITCSDGYLLIKGEKKAEHEEKGENFLRRESSWGAFQRSIALPEAADMPAAEAHFKDGVLTITVPKKAAAQQQEKKISIKSA